MIADAVSEFEGELEALINRYSGESDSGTPDFILAQFLVSCLLAWNAGVIRREGWYGRPPNPGPSVSRASDVPTL